MTDKFFCVRFYSNLDAVYAIRDEDGKNGWVDANKQMRPGCALFINCKHVEETGYLDSQPEVIKRIEEYLATIIGEYINDNTQVDTLAMRPEWASPAKLTRLEDRVRYPDDRDIVVSPALKKKLEGK
jgi:hypothetical protein